MSASSRTHSQDSFRASSQQATGGALEDTASSVHAGHVSHGSSATQSRRAPNTVFTRGTTLSRSRSVSPGLSRPASPLGVSVARRRAEYAERTAVSAISGVGQVADEVRMARAEATSAAADAQSAIGTVRQLAASLSAQTEATKATTASEIEERVHQVASYSDAQTTRATTQMKKQLESEIASATSSAAESSVMRTREAEQRIRRDVEAEMQKLQADARQEAENTHCSRQPRDKIGTADHPIERVQTREGGDSGGARGKIADERRNAVTVAVFALRQFC